MLKQPTYRSVKYMKFVKSLPSCISGMPADDAHHIKVRGFGGTTKCSDLFTIPLTREEHSEFHRIGQSTWEELHGQQLVFALRTIEAAFREGVFSENL